MAVNALVLAGQANTGPLKECSSASNEALIEIGGRPMIQYVIDGLRQAKDIGRIFVAAPPGELEPHVQGENLTFVASQGDPVETIRVANARLPADELLLIVTSDIPLITGPVIEGFLQLCRARAADLYYPVVEKSVNEQKYPRVTRTYVTLKEGVFTGGNLFLVNPRVIEETAPKVKRFIELRKQPLRLAGLLGWTFVLRFLLKNLSLADLEAKISKLWQLRGAVVICPYPEVGIDVDKPSDLQLARAALV